MLSTPACGRWMMFTFPDSRLRLDMPLCPGLLPYWFCAAFHAGHLLDRSTANAFHIHFYPSSFFRV